VVSMLTVFHDADHPSYLLLPITKGNVMNTYFSGGSFLAFEAHSPKRAL
jgi:hypothetical protein